MKQNTNNQKWDIEYQSCRLCLKLMETYLEDELISNLKHPANLVFFANIYRNCLVNYPRINSGAWWLVSLH